MLRWAVFVSVFLSSPMVRAAPSGGSSAVSVEHNAPSAGADTSPPDYRLVSAVGLASGYAAFGTWAWFAWYQDQSTLPEWKFGGDGWLGDATYAGGADKLGHVWASLALSRLGTELLRSGGWGRVPSSLAGSAFSLTALTMVEVNDGFYTEFSPADTAANALGAAAALVMNCRIGLRSRSRWRQLRSWEQHVSVLESVREAGSEPQIPGALDGHVVPRRSLE